MHRITLLVLFILTCYKGMAQTAPANASLTVQPEIMMMPYTKDTEDVRTVLQNNPQVRIGIAKVEEAFTKRGFKPKDFVMVLKEAKEANIINDDNKTDMKSQLALFAGADIYIETDITPYTANGESSVSIILKACEASTGFVLASKQDNGKSVRTADIGLLVSVAVEKMVDDFLANMQSQFDLVRVNGKSVKVYINFAGGSIHDTDSEIGGKGFAELMETWMENNAFKNYSKLASTMSKSMIFTEVRIPFKDVDRTRRSDTPGKFKVLITEYLKTLKMPATGYTKSGSIYITIK